MNLLHTWNAFTKIFKCTYPMYSFVDYRTTEGVELATTRLVSEEFWEEEVLGKVPGGRKEEMCFQPIHSTRIAYRS